VRDAAGAGPEAGPRRVAYVPVTGQKPGLAQIQPFSRLTMTAWARSTTLSLWYTLCR
jgi:hypothetical protein